MASTFGRVLLCMSAALAIANTSCNRQQSAHRQRKIEWHAIGSWSGHGNTQTDSFDIGYSDLRIRWETKNENPEGAGTFHLTVNSAVSGRELTTAADHKGPGHGLVYITLDPHWSYLVINSSNLDWSVTVEEERLVDGV